MALGAERFTTYRPENMQAESVLPPLVRHLRIRMPLQGYSNGVGKGGPICRELEIVPSHGIIKGSYHHCEAIVEGARAQVVRQDGHAVSLKQGARQFGAPPLLCHQGFGIPTQDVVIGAMSHVYKSRGRPRGKNYP